MWFSKLSKQQKPVPTRAGKLFFSLFKYFHQLRQIFHVVINVNSVKILMKIKYILPSKHDEFNFSTDSFMYIQVSA